MCVLGTQICVLKVQILANVATRVSGTPTNIKHPHLGCGETNDFVASFAVAVQDIEVMEVSACVFG